MSLTLKSRVNILEYSVNLNNAGDSKTEMHRNQRKEEKVHFQARGVSGSTGGISWNLYSSSVPLSITPGDSCPPPRQGTPGICIQRERDREREKGGGPERQLHSAV